VLRNQVFENPPSWISILGHNFGVDWKQRSAPLRTYSFKMLYSKSKIVYIWTKCKCNKIVAAWAAWPWMNSEWHYQISHRKCFKQSNLDNNKQKGWLSPTERASVSAINQRHILASMGTPLGQSRYRPNCYMDGKRIQCLSNASQHVPIYLYIQPFTSYSEILVGNCNFSYPLYLTPLLRVFPLEFREKVWSSEN